MIQFKNMIYKLLLLTLSLLGNVGLSAQEVDMMLYKRDVNGVEIGDTLTKSQVYSVFGVPSRYKYYDTGDLGVNETYYYGESFLDFKDNVFIGFCLRDSHFSAFTCHIEGGLHVGDPLRKLNGFRYGDPEYREPGRYNLFPTSDNPVYLIVSNGIITGIDYSDPL